MEKIIVSNGTNNIPVAVNDIMYITASTPYIVLHLESKQHLHSETLKSIQEQLDKSRFIRVHKSTIVNIDKVTSYKSRSNGDYDLTLQNGATTRLSRNFASGFKACFDNPTLVKQQIHQVKP